VSQEASEPTRQRLTFMTTVHELFGRQQDGAEITGPVDVGRIFADRDSQMIIRQ